VNAFHDPASGRSGTASPPPAPPPWAPSEPSEALGATAPIDDAPVIPARYPGRWISGAIVLIVAAAFVRVLVTNEHFQWGEVGHYFVSGLILRGLGMTLELTAIAMGIGIVLGIVLAVMRMSPNPLVSYASRIYIWFFRGTPLLVQLIFWYNLAALFPRIGIGIPFGPAFTHVSANHLIRPFTAAILGLGLNEGAYMSEIVRAGILSVNQGQVDAARGLGMTRLLAMRRIVLPQAMRVIVPPTGNETIGMLKMTSLVSVIALAELLYSAQEIYSSNFETIPLLVVVSFWYLIVTSVLTLVQSRIEAYFGRGRAGQQRAGFRAGAATTIRMLRLGGR
jgi:polar amino acid transport system permease protein